MTESFEPFDPDFDDSPEPPQRSGLTGFTVRVLLLLLAGGLAAIVGIIFAIANPQPPAPKPVLLRWWEGVTRWGEPRRLPQETPLDDSQRPPTPEQIQGEIMALSQQWNRIRDRIIQLETQLGISPNLNQTLPERLQSLQDKAQTLPPPAPIPTLILPGNLPPLPGRKLKVTLPNDVLFNDNNQLSPEGSLLLDSIINDLSPHSRSTIRIAAHTDSQTSLEESRELSFQLANTVRQYLASELRGRYRWVAIGYGQTRPLVLDNTEVNRQRNRRVEIAVD
ncbi:OmpA family protein [Spirulina subsalsa FACHB-351]|uniref:OmpA family protein n=1 Tax=Spirulina subsalsa FACHB-351 TaxID=234711 RepID=A0ABT3L2T8_9CYAN|nr:OmpA family protein [Spirulina subsalsa]MCW6035825.1 OmpA family protein [Spirulina subsalsa FACHB-351]